MQFGVNLLPRQEFKAKNEKTVVLLKKISFIVLGAYTLFLLGLGGFYYYVSTNKVNLTSEIAETQKKIKSYEKKENLLVTVKERMVNIAQILNNRKRVENTQGSYEQILAWLKNLLVPGVSITEVGIKDGILDFQGRAENALAIGEFLAQFEKLERQFPWLSLESLSRNSKGEYAFSFKAMLPQVK